jgi:hypothetical protein
MGKDTRKKMKDGKFLNEIALRIISKECQSSFIFHSKDDAHPHLKKLLTEIGYCRFPGNGSLPLHSTFCNQFCHLGAEGGAEISVCTPKQIDFSPVRGSE